MKGVYLAMTKYIYRNKTRTFEKLPKYIYQRRNGWFEIRKRIGGVLLYWGSFPTLEEAILHKAYYLGKNWQVNPSFKNMRNIIQRDDKYMVLKKIDGKTVSFGTFNNLKDAIHERDVCTVCDWNYDLICEWED